MSDTKSTPEFHVACSDITGVIYAGTLSKNKNRWLKKSDVTEESLAAVRDHFMNKREDGIDSVGYQWTKKDGTIVTLQLNVIEPQKDVNSNA